MEDIRIYDFEFNLLHIENKIISSNWTIYYNKVGTWEGHFSPDSEVISIMMNNPYVIIAQGDKQAIITGKQATSEGVFYGKTVNWILSRRTYPRFKSSELSIGNNTSERIARHLVSQSFNDVDNFVLGDILGNGDIQIFWRNTTNPLNEVIADCLDLDNNGHNVVFDIPSKKWVFNVIQGTEKADLISDENKNAYETEYVEDLQGYFSSGWYERDLEDMGDWNASTNKPTLTDKNTSNYAKYYRVSVEGVQFGISFKDGDLIVCRNTNGTWEKAKEVESILSYLEGEKTGIYKWDGVLSGTNQSEAIASLKAKKWSKEIKTKTRQIKYGIDYNLGDIFRIQKSTGSWQTTFKKRVTGVNLWYENNNIGEQPIFEEV